MDAIEVNLSELRPHPRNYKTHPEDQLAHIRASIEQFGVFRNVVIARDKTILAGHGVVLALQQLGRITAPAVQLDLEPESAAALKVLALDNELGHFAERDDRVLSEILRSVHEGESLLGTGYDENMLSALVMTTRMRDEIGSIDEAKEWLGMPDYDSEERQWKLVMSFSSEADRLDFVKQKEIRLSKALAEAGGGTWSARWPYEGDEDVAALRFADKSRPKQEKAEAPPKRRRKKSPAEEPTA